MLTILNLNRTEDRVEIFTPTLVTGEQFQETHSTNATDQVLKNAGQCVFWLFDKDVTFFQPLVDAATYEAMTADQKAQHCTLDTVNTYLVVGEVSGETTLETLRATQRVYKVNAIEFKKMGTLEVRHIRILAK